MNEASGMTDKQFKAFIRLLLISLQSAIAEKDPKMQQTKLIELQKELKLSLEG